MAASWQAALLGPEMMEGSLTELAKWQGKEENDWRDEQPGRMLHEAQDSPLAMLQYSPHARYYGSITTSAFYPVIVSELWHWTGKKELIEPFITPAEGVGMAGPVHQHAGRRLLLLSNTIFAGRTPPGVEGLRRRHRARRRRAS